MFCFQPSKKVPSGSSDTPGSRQSSSHTVAPPASAKSRQGRILQHMEDPSTKLYLLFLKNTLPLFNSMNLLLQRDEPCVHVLHAKCTDLITGLFVRFITPQAIVNSVSLVDLDYKSRENQKDGDALVIG